MSQLECSKMILSKVSFDDELFWKEYRKFRRTLRSSTAHLPLIFARLRVRQYYLESING